MLDRRPDRAGRTWGAFAFREMWIELIELPHLAVGAPTQIAVAGVLHIHTGNLLETARLVEARCQFVGERLVVNKAVGAGRADRLFVEVHGVERAALDAGDLGADQCGAILEILRAIRRPGLELGAVAAQRRDTLTALFGGRRRVASCTGEGRVEMVFGDLEQSGRRPQKGVRLGCGGRGGHEITR